MFCLTTTACYVLRRLASIARSRFADAPREMSRNMKKPIVVNLRGMIAEAGVEHPLLLQYNNTI